MENSAKIERMEIIMNNLVKWMKRMIIGTDVFIGLYACALVDQYMNTGRMNVYFASWPTFIGGLLVLNGLAWIVSKMAKRV